MNAKNILSKLKKIAKIEFAFALIALFWGIILVFLIPPLQVPDEGSHFIRAWGISTLQWRCDEKLRVEAPQNIGNLAVNLDEQKINSGIYPDSETQKYLDEKIDSHKDKYCSQFCLYSPISHVPQSLGIVAARILDSSALQTLYLGRITNLLISILLIFWAIRLAPFGKIVFLFTGLLPMTMQQFSSLSGDALNFSGILFFSALALNLSQKENLRGWQLAGFAVSSLAFIHTKPGYAGILLLFLLLRPYQFPSRMKYAAFLGIVFAANIIIAFTLANSADTENYLRPDQVSPEKQIALMKENPTTFFSAVGHELEKNSIVYLTGMIGRLGLLSVKLPAFLHLLIPFALIIFLTSSREKVVLTAFQRLILFSSSALVIISVFLLEYIFWTVPGQDSIDGIQGRYFVPVAPLLILSVYRLRFSKFWKFVCLIAIFSAISLITLSSIKSHYYKKHLMIKPKYCKASLGFNEILTQKGNLKEKENGTSYSSGKKSTLKLNVSDTCGIAFRTSRKVKVKLNYIFKAESQDAFIDKNESIASTEEVVLNFDLLEKNTKREIQELNMEIISSNPFEILEVETYKQQ